MLTNCVQAILNQDFSRHRASLISGLPSITIGPVGAANSVLGTAANQGFSMVSSYDAARTQLIVGRPKDNKVTILRHLADLSHWIYLPVVTK